jgi:S-adenosylmethionine:tRNA-ribosyltransferase-isomerase (queuine synthetase)
MKAIHELVVPRSIPSTLLDAMFKNLLQIDFLHEGDAIKMPKSKRLKRKLFSLRRIANTAVRRFISGGDLFRMKQ